MKPARLLFLTALLTLTAYLNAFPLPVAAAESYKVDPVHSSVIFRVQHIGISFVYGRFNNLNGSLTFDAASAAGNSINVSLQVNDIDTFNEKRDKHLKSPDFFDAEKYPTISFKSTSFKQIDKDKYEVAGDLSMHGVTRPITVTAEMTGSGKDPWGGYRIGFETSFAVNRSDYGIAFLPEAVGQEVLLMVSIEAVRQ